MYYFPLVSDPTHTFIGVPASLLRHLNLYNTVTPYSHRSHNGKTVWLHSEHDAPDILEALKVVKHEIIVIKTVVPAWIHALPSMPDYASRTAPRRRPLRSLSEVHHHVAAA